MNDEFVGQQFTWFTGQVEDVQDPLFLNRVKVRCFGYYDDNEVTTEDLPWATVMMPTTSASTLNNGSNHQLEVGSWVVGFFRDGPSAQDPLIMGSIASQTGGERDVPEAESYDRKVHVSQAGHALVFDNTLDQEAIEIRHGKYYSRIIFSDDGSLEIESHNNKILLRDYEPGGENTPYISITPAAGGDIFLNTTGGDINLNAKNGGKVNFTGTAVALNNPRRRSRSRAVIARQNSESSAASDTTDARLVGDSRDLFEPTDNARDAVLQYLGVESIDDREFDELLRATAAEAGVRSGEERAAVAAVILNRVLSNSYSDTIHGVLHQSGQFQAVTGSSDNGFRPARNFTHASQSTIDDVDSEIAQYLGGMDKSWLNFVSALDGAYTYGPNCGTTNGPMNYMLATGAGRQIGDSVFGNYTTAESNSYMTNKLYRNRADFDAKRNPVFANYEEWRYWKNLPAGPEKRRLFS